MHLYRGDSEIPFPTRTKLIGLYMLKCSSVQRYIYIGRFDHAVFVQTVRLVVLCTDRKVRLGSFRVG